MTVLHSLFVYAAVVMGNAGMPLRFWLRSVCETEGRSRTMDLLCHEWDAKRCRKRAWQRSA